MLHNIDPAPTPTSVYADLIPTLTPSTSSAFRAYGYRASLQALYIQFANGSIWAYLDIPQSKVDEMLAAPSMGSYWTKQIKGTGEGSGYKSMLIIPADKDKGKQTYK